MKLHIQCVYSNGSTKYVTNYVTTDEEEIAYYQQFESKRYNASDKEIRGFLDEYFQSDVYIPEFIDKPITTVTVTITEVP